MCGLHVTTGGGSWSKPLRTSGPGAHMSNAACQMRDFSGPLSNLKPLSTLVKHVKTAPYAAPRDDISTTNPMENSNKPGRLRLTTKFHARITMGAIVDPKNQAAFEAAEETLPRPARPAPPCGQIPSKPRRASGPQIPGRPRRPPVKTVPSKLKTRAALGPTYLLLSTTPLHVTFIAGALAAPLDPGIYM